MIIIHSIDYMGKTAASMMNLSSWQKQLASDKVHGFIRLHNKSDIR